MSDEEKKWLLSKTCWRLWSLSDAQKSMGPNEDYYRSLIIYGFPVSKVWPFFWIYLFLTFPIIRSIIQASSDILEYQAIQLSFEKIEIRLVLKEGSDRVNIEKNILENLEHWFKAIGLEICEVNFNNKEPEKNPISKKLIRVRRDFNWI